MKIFLRLGEILEFIIRMYKGSYASHLIWVQCHSGKRGSA